MAYDGEGQIRIDLADFWQFVQKYQEHQNAEITYGVPRVEGDSIVVDYAYSSECSPVTWAKKPKAVLQWEEETNKKRDNK